MGSNLARNPSRSNLVSAKENGNLSDELRIWIDWAREKVDWYDPLVNRKDDVFDDNWKIRSN
jgi:hypothetical protein